MIQQKTQSRAFSAFCANASSLGAVPSMDMNCNFLEFSMGIFWIRRDLRVNRSEPPNSPNSPSIWLQPTSPIWNTVISRWSPSQRGNHMDPQSWRFGIRNDPFQETKQSIPVDEVIWSVLYIYNIIPYITLHCITLHYITFTFIFTFTFRFTFTFTFTLPVYIYILCVYVYMCLKMDIPWYSTNQNGHFYRGEHDFFIVRPWLQHGSNMDQWIHKLWKITIFNGKIHHL